MANATELETYRAIVLQIFQKETGFALPAVDGIPTEERVERTIRRYRVAHESCRNCANAIIASMA